MIATTVGEMRRSVAVGAADVTARERTFQRRDQPERTVDEQRSDEPADRHRSGAAIEQQTDERDDDDREQDGDDRRRSAAVGSKPACSCDPSSARPNGPITAIAAVTTPVIGHANESAPVNTAAHTSATFGLVEPHQRRANRVAHPGW